MAGAVFLLRASPGNARPPICIKAARLFTVSTTIARLSTDGKNRLATLLNSL